MLCLFKLWKQEKKSVIYVKGGEKQIFQIHCTRDGKGHTNSIVVVKKMPSYTPLLCFTKSPFQYSTPRL